MLPLLPSAGALGVAAGLGLGCGLGLPPLLTLPMEEIVERSTWATSLHGLKRKRRVSSQHRVRAREGQ